MNEDDIPKFKIEKTNVVKRPDEELKGELTSEQISEFVQDLRIVHGLWAEEELTDILRFEKGLPDRSWWYLKRRQYRRAIYEAYLDIRYRNQYDNDR